MGVPVVLGGLHVSLMPEEAAAHADSIVLDGAEGVWPELIWLSRLNARREGLIRAHGSDLVKIYIRGFRCFILGFESGSLGLYRVAFRPRVNRLT
jgi:hypothetical protein